MPSHNLNDSSSSVDPFWAEAGSDARDPTSAQRGERRGKSRLAKSNGPADPTADLAACSSVEPPLQVIAAPNGSEVSGPAQDTTAQGVLPGLDSGSEAPVLDRPLQAPPLDPMEAVREARRKRAEKRKQEIAAAHSPRQADVPDIKAEKSRPNEARYLSVRQVAERYSVGVATVWRWVKELDRFPKPIHLSPGTTRWREVELEAYERAMKGSL